MFIFRTITFVYHVASATSLGVVLIVGVIIYALSRYFRLKQPNLPKNLIDAIGGIQHIERVCSTGQYNHRCDSSDPSEWWPIANRAACLDSIENSRSAIEKVSQFGIFKRNKMLFRLLHGISLASGENPKKPR